MTRTHAQRLRDWVKSRLRKGTIAYGVLGHVWRVVSNADAFAKAAYRRVTKNSIFFAESELFMCSLLPRHVLDAVIERFRPASVLDIGCGTGRSLDYFLEHGVDATGIEGSRLAIGRARHPERIVRANLNAAVDLGRRFDLVWSFEVVEHIHPSYVDNLVSTFCNHGDRLVLSAARPGQAGEGHFNCQPPEYWIEKFGARGFRHDAESTALLRSLPDEHASNLLVFLRA